MKPYYVYIAYLDKIPRYIGFGKGNRYTHVNSGTSHQRKLNEVVLKDEKVFVIQITATNLSKEEAQIKEIELIAFYGLLEEGGTLYNQTKGGIGYRAGHTKTSKEKISNASKEMWKNRTLPERNRIVTAWASKGEITRFKKGAIPYNKAEWKLTNKLTGEFFIIEDRKTHEKRDIVWGMSPNKDYKRGIRINWYLEKL